MHKQDGSSITGLHCVWVWLRRLFSFFSLVFFSSFSFLQLSVNLYELLKQNGYRGLSWSLLRMFLKQLLDSLSVLAVAKIIHCDLKPEVRSHTHSRHRAGLHSAAMSVSWLVLTLFVSLIGVDLFVFVHRTFCSTS